MIVFVAAPERVIEDGWIRGETGDGEVLNVAAERAFHQQSPGDIVQPKALTQVVQLCVPFILFLPDPSRMMRLGAGVLGCCQRALRG